MPDLGALLAAFGQGAGEYTQRSRKRRLENEDRATVASDRTRKQSLEDALAAEQGVDRTRRRTLEDRLAEQGAADREYEIGQRPRREALLDAQISNYLERPLREPKAPNLITAPDPKDPSRLIRVPDVEGQQVPSPSGGGLSGAALKKAVAENRAQISLIDAAIKELDANPTAVGVGMSKGGAARALGAVPGMAKLGEVAKQKADPVGQTARDKLGAVGSVVIKDISGAAVSGPEWTRLGWVPDPIYDYESNRKKLQSMKERAETTTREMEAALGGTSGRSRGAATADPEFDALMAKYPKKP